MHTTMFFRQQEEGLQIFIKGWELYQKIIQRNYMKHAEIVTGIDASTDDLRMAELSILEVGCGDAYAISQALRDRQDVRYTGIDMSQHALDYAGKNLARIVGNSTCRWATCSRSFPGSKAGLTSSLADIRSIILVRIEKRFC